MQEPVNVRASADGTKKYLFKAGDYSFIESAFIPENKRATICLSSQVGCEMGCLFCITGQPEFRTNLIAGEILTAHWGFTRSPRKITVSTIGVMPAIRHFLETSECHFAVSLHAPF